jgi:hypothetical protein
LTNALAVFVELMNRVFHPYLDNFVLVFIDDVLIYSEGEVEHEQHFRTVLDTLRKEDVVCKVQRVWIWVV